MQPVQKVKASKATNNSGNNSKGLEALLRRPIGDAERRNVSWNQRRKEKAEKQVGRDSARVEYSRGK